MIFQIIQTPGCWQKKPREGHVGDHNSEAIRLENDKHNPGFFEYMFPACYNMKCGT